MDYNSLLSAPISPSLFQKEDGEQMCFYIYPCSERRLIRAAIEKGNGILVPKKEPDCIILLPEGRHFSFEPNVVRSKFIWDSIKANQLANIEDYKICFEQNEELNQDDDIVNIDSSTLFNVDVKEKSDAKRKEYTFADDEKILNYVIKHNSYSYIKGVEIWKNLESKQLLPGRTWQSLKERFRKQIVPRLDQFRVAEYIKKRILAHAPHASVVQYNKSKKSAHRKLPVAEATISAKPKRSVAPMTESTTSLSTHKPSRIMKHASCTNDESPQESSESNTERGNQSRMLQEADQGREDHLVQPTFHSVIQEEDSKPRTERGILAYSNEDQNESLRPESFAKESNAEAEIQMDTSETEIAESSDYDIQDDASSGSIEIPISLDQSQVLTPLVSILTPNSREIGVMTDPLITGCGQGICYDLVVKGIATCHFRDGQEESEKAVKTNYMQSCEQQRAAKNVPCTIT